jgi:hypothetical protein
MRNRGAWRTISGMSSGRHTVVIELEALEGPPSGSISVDGGAKLAFYGWIDLSAQLESLTRPSPCPPGPHARVERRM